MKRFENLLALVSGVALFVMMCLTFVDVIGRKFFQASLVGGLELTEIAMLLTIFFALPLTSIAGEHIVFDVLDRVVPPWMRHLQHTIAHLVAALLFFGGAWVVHLRAARALEYGDVTAQLGIPLGPFQYLITVMLALTGIIHVLLALRRIEEHR